jgi:hypothetical protein
MIANSGDTSAGDINVAVRRSQHGDATTSPKTIPNNKCGFLSDDMVILNQRGVVLSYPKPLTISRHTLQAVPENMLRVHERLALFVQSRIHSRSGRRIGMLLAGLGLPAATLNTVLQILVPPPKYGVERLFPNVEIEESAYLSSMVMIERGEDQEEQIDHYSALTTLIANSEDAYGFPPYPLIANQLCQWKGVDLHYDELRIISHALLYCTTMRMRSSSFGWWQHLPALLDRQQLFIKQPGSAEAITVPVGDHYNWLSEKR